MTATNPIDQYYSRLGVYPANNQQWWLARSEIDDPTSGLLVGDFMPELLQKLYMGNLHAPRGHYILDAFVKDRSAISGVSGLDAEPTKERPTSVAFFSGRAWFACNSTVYFSQIMTTKFQAALCHMDADPTSENISDPLATDGGVVPIPEANRIIRLTPHAGGVLVFAQNGVWFITGTSSGFTATDFSVNKVSPVGCHSPLSVVETDTAVFWWSEVGIMGVTETSQGEYGSVPGLQRTNVSETTIQAFYNKISDANRKDVKGVYDPKSNVIYWLYRSEGSPAGYYDSVLCLDLTLNAFYPWKFSRPATGPIVKGIFASTQINTYTVPTDIEPSIINYITPKGSVFKVSQVRSGQFVDFYSYDVTGATYDSYMEAGYELFDDAMRKKNITYLFTYLTRTETSATGDVADYPSSCKLMVKYDWASGAQSNKYTLPVEIYRPGRLLLDNPDTGFGMVVTKNKVRGNGKALQFRFECSDPGKNFDLHGWAIAVSGSPAP